MSEIAAWLRERTDAMVELTRELVSAESPSGDADALTAAVDLLIERTQPLLGVAPTRLGTAEAPALTWSLPAVRSDRRPVVLLAHLDPATAWDAVSASARAVMGSSPAPLEPGAPAEILAVRGDSLADALARASEDRVVVHRGRVVARTTVQTEISRQPQLAGCP